MTKLSEQQREAMEAAYALDTKGACGPISPANQVWHREGFEAGFAAGLAATKEFLNVRETANELNVHENTVRNLEKRGQLKAIKLPGSGFRRFRKEDIDRMRAEMWSQFAPDTEMPEAPRRPSRRATLTDEDYAALTTLADRQTVEGDQSA